MPNDNPRNSGQSTSQGRRTGNLTQEDRERGGEQSSTMQDRDEQGQFEGNAGTQTTAGQHDDDGRNDMRNQSNPQNRQNHGQAGSRAHDNPNQYHDDRRPRSGT